MDNLSSVQLPQQPQLNLTLDEAKIILENVTYPQNEASKYSSLDALIPKVMEFVNANKPTPTFGQAKIFPSISIYHNENDELPEKGFPGVHILSIIRRLPKWEDHFITWGLDTAGLPSGIVALPFLYGDVVEPLNDENSYSAIRQESQFILIIRTSGIKDAEHYKIAYNRVCEYYCQRYKLVPALDASDISTRLRVGHDPLIKQDFTRPIIPFEEMRFPVDSVIQSEEITDEALILKVVELIRQGKSQRKITQELGVPQPRISRLIAKNKG
jgi:hypothetical protein